MKKLIILAIIALFTQGAIAQSTKTAAKAKKVNTPKKPEWEMKQYFLVFLKKGPNRTHDSITAQTIQKGHIGHLDSLYKAGKLDIAGPLGDDGEIRGICVYNVANIEEAKKLAELDPAVRSGRLIVEIHPLWAARDSKLR